jgi:hypothetical protein
VATQFALTEGLPAAGLAIISIALARAARRSGAAGAARVALIVVRSARNPRRTWRTMLDATPDETMHGEQLGLVQAPRGLIMTGLGDVLRPAAPGMLLPDRGGGPRQ